MVECTELKKEIKSDNLVQQKIVYEDIFMDTFRQKNITTLFTQLVNIKKSKIEMNNPSTPQTNCEVLKIGDKCNLSFGK